MSTGTPRRLQAPLLAFRSWLDYRWQQCRQIIEVLSYTRFSVFVVLVGCLALLLHPQGREIAARAGTSYWDFLWYPLATWFWAFQVWFWALLILNMCYVRRSGEQPGPSERDAHVAQAPDPADTSEADSRIVLRPDCPETSLRYSLTHGIPNWLGYIACAMPLAAIGWMVRVNQSAGAAALALMAMLVGVLITFGLFLNRRIRIADRLMRLRGERYDSSQDLAGLARWVTCFSTLQLLGLTIWAWVSPNSMGRMLGTVPTLLLGFASIVPAGSWLVLKTLRVAFPTITTLLTIGLLCSSCHPHYMRTLGPMTAERPTLANELDRWIAQAPQDGHGKGTLVLVATAGGGITAAYWTTVVLTHLRDADPQFTQRLFSISAVSGGSVGATVFAQALRCNREHFSGNSARDALTGDVLAPVLGSALYGDLLYWFPPFSLLAGTSLTPPDRAVAFERELDWNWRTHFQHDCPGVSLDESFAQQRTAAMVSGVWQPILMLNATHQETGRLVVMSQVSLANGARDNPFNPVIDYFALTHMDLPLSTAALNSARFPYISPAGQMRADHSTLAMGHLVDGGYFNNDGAVTTLKLLDALRLRLVAARNQVRVIIIQISVDAPLPNERELSTRNPAYIADEVVHASHLANEALAPVNTLMAMRNGHGQTARDDLRGWTDLHAHEIDASYVHFRLLIPRPTAERPKSVKPPLGWVLSPASQTQMAERTLCLDSNYSEWRRLMGLLGVFNDSLRKCGDAVFGAPPGLAPPEADVSPHGIGESAS